MNKENNNPTWTKGVDHTDEKNRWETQEPGWEPHTVSKTLSLEIEIKRLKDKLQNKTGNRENDALRLMLISRTGYILAFLY